MMSLKQIKWILVIGFYGVVFVADTIAWVVINQLLGFEMPTLHIIGVAAIMTFISCTMYLVLRELYQRIRGYKETTLAEVIYEVFRAD